VVRPHATRISVCCDRCGVLLGRRFGYRRQWRSNHRGLRSRWDPEPDCVEESPRHSSPRPRVDHSRVIQRRFTKHILVPSPPIPALSPLHLGQSDHRNDLPDTDGLSARIESPARRITLHLTKAWPWETGGRPCSAALPGAAELDHLTTQLHLRNKEVEWNQWEERPAVDSAQPRNTHSNRDQTPSPKPTGGSTPKSSPDSLAIALSESVAQDESTCRKVAARDLFKDWISI
jgi:hypothetical protein